MIFCFLLYLCRFLWIYFSDFDKYLFVSYIIRHCLGGRFCWPLHNLLAFSRAASHYYFNNYYPFEIKWPNKMPIKERHWKNRKINFNISYNRSSIVIHIKIIYFDYLSVFRSCFIVNHDDNTLITLYLIVSFFYITTICYIIVFQYCFC